MTKQKYLVPLLIALICAAASAQPRNEDIGLEAAVGQTAYGLGDTVVIGLRAAIPPGYHLYGNPLGPGIGKPLNLFVSKTSLGNKTPWNITWTEARKSVPKRFQPPIGSWVWAYEREAFFFVKGVLTFDSTVYSGIADSINAARDSARAAEASARKRSGTVAKGRAAATPPPAVTVDTYVPVDTALRYELLIDALICRTACVPVGKSVLLDLTASTDPERQTGRGAFPATSTWQTRLDRSEPMDFRISEPEPAVQQLSTGGGSPETGGINLGLSGLSNISGELTDSTAAAAISPVPADGDGSDAWDYTPFEENRREYGLLTAIIFALIAGLAMNLTPCIFPVLSIRILSFAQSSQESHSRAVTRSVAFAGGILVVFLLLAALAAFAGFSWGQQFQNPGMMVGIIAVIFLFALGMFNFYTVKAPASISNSGQKAGTTLTGDLLKGAAATVMATPCAGPFLGALLAWALLQKPLIIFTVFAVMGVGMAVPYVLLSSSKKLMSLLPKPGRWIEDMKHAMGFLLLAFAVMLMKSLDPRLTVTAVGICLSVLCAASLNKRFAPFGTAGGRRVKVMLLSIAALTAGTIFSVTYLRLDIPLFNDDQLGLTNENRAVWQEFTPHALAAAHEEGRNVVVNFTALWCTNCKLNKATVLNTAAAREAYANKNILLLTADITNPNTPAQSLLHHLGSRSVPFLAIFPSDSPKHPIIMRDLLSKEKFLTTLNGLP